MEERKKEANASHVHIPKSYEKTPNAFHQLIKDFFFDCVILLGNIVIYIFFREVSVRGSFNIPKSGPTIVVVAPHANQFVDGAIIMTQLRTLVNRNSPPIIAESSYKGGFIGALAKLAGAIPVPRAQDNLKFVDGEIYLKEGSDVRIYGKGTKFTTFTPKGLLGLPEFAGNAEILEIVSDTELILKKQFKHNKKSTSFLKNGTKFKYTPKISTDVTFQHVFSSLHNGGIITIFPEGGSHDRPELLPIKAGFAIMALGAVAGDSSQPVNIVPTGLNYFHRNKFRSRAVVEFGTPIKVTAEDGELYKKNPREAVSKLLSEVTTALNSVTLTAPDYETLMVIQAARRLYTKKVPLSLVVDINRNLLAGYTHYKDNPRIIELKKNVIDYNIKLKNLGLKDHQVELTNRSSIESFGILIVRTLKLLFLLMLSLPGTVLFAPIFIVTDKISQKKQKKALAGSAVKIKGVDVVATWKILVALFFAPSLYITYSLMIAYLTKKYNLLEFGYLNYIPLFIIVYLILVLTTWSAFRIGEAGVDIFKSLPPLFHSVFGSGKELAELKKTKENLQLELTDVVNDLGPKLFPKFDKFNKVKARLEDEDGDDDDDDDDDYDYRGRSKVKINNEQHSRSVSTSSNASSIGLSKFDSDGYLSDVPILGDGDQYNHYDSIDDIYSKVKSTGTDNDTSVKLRKALRERIQATNDDSDEE